MISPFFGIFFLASFFFYLFFLPLFFTTRNYNWGVLGGSLINPPLCREILSNSSISDCCCFSSLAIHRYSSEKSFVFLSKYFWKVVIHEVIDDCLKDSFSVQVFFSVFMSTRIGVLIRFIYFEVTSNLWIYHAQAKRSVLWSGQSFRLFVLTVAISQTALGFISNIGYDLRSWVPKEFLWWKYFNFFHYSFQRFWITCKLLFRKTPPTILLILFV